MGNQWGPRDPSTVLLLGRGTARGALRNRNRHHSSSRCSPPAGAAGGSLAPAPSPLCAPAPPSGSAGAAAHGVGGPRSASGSPHWIVDVPDRCVGISSLCPQRLATCTRIDAWQFLGSSTCSTRTGRDTQDWKSGARNTAERWTTWREEKRDGCTVLGVHTSSSVKFRFLAVAVVVVTKTLL